MGGLLGDLIVYVPITNRWWSVPYYLLNNNAQSTIVSILLPRPLFRPYPCRGRRGLVVKAAGWLSLDRQFEPYPRANTVAPSWCGLGCRSRTLMVEYISPLFFARIQLFNRMDIVQHVSSVWRVKSIACKIFRFASETQTAVCVKILLAQLAVQQPPMCCVNSYKRQYHSPILVT